MKVFTTKENLAHELSRLKLKGRTIGFVPTMGALHLGHLSLIKKAMSENDEVVVSIFVNPTQFNSQEDLNKYPRTPQRDMDLLKTLATDKLMVYLPEVYDIYNNNVNSEKFSFDGLEDAMEGKFRPGHFDGVGTVVKRLLEIVKPHKAYFGEKDFQQLIIIKRLVEDFNLPIEIIGCEIHREPSGLAMSSRNERLRSEYKNAAPFIYKILNSAKQKFGTESADKVMEWVVRQFANHDLLTLEYFTIADVKTLRPIKRKSKNKKYRAFIAVYAGNIRLIDNIALN